MINYTFIIPHKNCPELLKRCVDSIPLRDDVEIIIVDDNSDDSKKPTLEREGLKVIFLDVEHSNGAGHARNVGLAEAKGKWLMFPDADDYYRDGFLEDLDLYKDSTDGDVVYFSFEYKDGESGENLTISFKNFIDNYDGTVEMEDKVKFLIIPPWTKMVRYSYMLKYGIQFEEVINGNDLFFSMRIGYHATNILVLKKPLYLYIKNDNSLSNKKKASTEAHLCRIKHVMQLNRFYSYIGHPEWRSSLFMRILRSCKDGGWRVVLSLLFQFPKIVFTSNKLVQLIKNN